MNLVNLTAVKYCRSHSKFADGANDTYGWVMCDEYGGDYSDIYDMPMSEDPEEFFNRVCDDACGEAAYALIDFALENGAHINDEWFSGDTLRAWREQHESTT